MSKKLFFFGMAVLAIALLAVTSCDRNNPLDSAQDLNISEPSGTTESLAIEDPQGREPPTTSGATTWPRSMADFKFPFQGVYNNYYTGPIWRITCGYNTYPYHVHNWYSEGAGKYSIDLIRYGSQSLGQWVLAPARGVVIYAGWKSGYGWCVVMDHDNGNTGKGYTSIVAHLHSNPTQYVHVGNDLLQGTVLGKCGASGGNWPAHIHFSVWKNDFSVPLNGLSGGPSLIVGGLYRSGNALVPPPYGW